MFSRTTMASSIRMPMDSDIAINVMKLMVNPIAYNTMKVAKMEMGNVKPVMTVERHE